MPTRYKASHISMLTSVILALFLFLFAAQPVAAREGGRADSLKHILRSSEEGETVDILNQLSEVHAGSDWAKSQRYAGLALDLAISQQDKYGQGVAHAHLARYYNAMKAYRSALDHANMAVSQFEFLGDDWQIARTLRTIGKTYSELNQSDQSLDYFLRALMIFEDINNAPEIAVTVTAIGDVYTQWEQTEKALRFYDRALSIYQERKFVRGILDSDNRLARSLMKLRRFSEAEEHLMSALTISLNGENVDLLSQLYSSLGELYFHQYQLDTAQKYFLMSLDLKLDLGDQGQIAMAMSDVAMVFQKAGDMGKARDYLEQALDKVQDSSHKSTAAKIRLQLGRLHMEAGNKEQALRALRSGLEIAMVADDLLTTQQANLLLTEAYARFDQPRQALVYQKAVQDVRDQINKQQSNRRVAELEIRYELDKRVNELNLLKESALVKDMEYERRLTIMWVVLGFSIFIMILFVGFAFYRNSLIRQSEREKMEHTLRLKADFTAMLVHDLRSPLTSVYGFAELLKMGEKPFERIREIATTIREASQKMLQLVNEMLDLSKFEAGKMVLSKTQVALKPVISASIQMLEPVAAQRGSEITLEAENGLSACYCDPRKIEQVITNFISNALQHTPKGTQIKVHLHEHRQQDKNYMYFSVEDDGPGIEPDQQKRVFDKYAQLESRNSGGSAVGTGLGLAVSQMIIEQHGGQVGYRQREPEGSIFYFQIPCDAPKDVSRKAPAETPVSH